MPESYRPDEGIRDVCFEMNHAAGQARLEGILFDGVFISHSQCRLPRPVKLYAQSDYPTIEMHFALCGCSQTRPKGSSRTYRFDCGEHNLIYAPDFEGSLVMEPCEDYRMFEINFSEEYFQRLAQSGDPLLDAMLEHMLKKRHFTARRHNYTITTRMQQVIEGIVGCQKQGVIRKLYLESQVLELLALQLEQLSGQENSVPSVSKADREKLQAARQLLEERFDNPPTLSQLSRLAGLNEFKLKRGFRELFGTSVYGHVLDLRMKKAQGLLRESGKTVAQIAEQVGYRHATHFTAAFKKKFGYLPAEGRA